MNNRERAVGRRLAVPRRDMWWATGRQQQEKQRERSHCKLVPQAKPIYLERNKTGSVVCGMGKKLTTRLDFHLGDQVGRTVGRAGW